MKNIKDNKGITNMTLLTIVLVIIILMLLAAVIYLVKNPNTTYITQNTPNEQQLTNSSKTEEQEVVKENIQVSNNVATNTVTNENQYEKIKGTYEYRTESYPGYEGITIYYRLSLKEDGTFNYLTVVDNHGGFCGNYIINGSEIILNRILNYGSDIAMSVVSGQVRLKINEDGTISDSNKYERLPIDSVILNKKSADIEKSETLKSYINIGAKNNSIYYEGYKFSE